VTPTRDNKLKVKTSEIKLSTSGEGDIVDVTEKVETETKASKLSNGIASIFVPGSTGAITTIEYEPGLLKDLPTALERVAPKGASYEHQKMWHDGNGHSHVRAAMIGPSLTVPIVNGHLSLGTWQQIVFLELDVRPRDRSLVLTIIGE
jgi:secondary thiamine-phosphate synthase enzyme